MHSHQDTTRSCQDTTHSVLTIPGGVLTILGCVLTTLGRVLVTLGGVLRTLGGVLRTLGGVWVSLGGSTTPGVWVVFLTTLAFVRAYNDFDSPNYPGISRQIQVAGPHSTKYVGVAISAAGLSTNVLVVPPAIVMVVSPEVCRPLRHHRVLGLSFILSSSSCWLLRLLQ